MKKITVFLGCFILVICMCATAFAASKATEAECIAKCKEAAQWVKDKGLEATLKEVNNPKGAFVWKDTYVFAIDMQKGTVLAHPIKPKLIGKALLGIKDINGKMFIAEFIKVAKTKGEGWVEYMWPKPGEKKPSPKKTYVYRVPGTNVVMAAGVYY